MRKLFHAIKKLFEAPPPEKKYFGKDIYQWHSDFRRSNQATLKDIIAALKESENLPSDLKLNEERVIAILSKTNSKTSLCLCAYAVSKFKTISNETEDLLVLHLSHYDETVRRFFAISLTEIGNVKGLSAVVEGNNHGHGIRTLAAHKIKNLGPKAIDAIPSLIKLLEYKKINWRSHFAAAEALSSIGPAAIEPLLKNLDSNDKNLKYYSAIALNYMEPKPYTNEKITKILKKAP